MWERRQLAAIDAHLMRLSDEFRSAQSASDFAAQLQLEDRIDVLLDRRLRLTGELARSSAA